ncbi:hypothetical protein TNCV_349771 [Trichonephila clavipes]|nr:hypothetical protein TNCV_349771 [Trichonephila clavipes]
MCANFRVRSSTFHGRCSRLLIISQTCLIGAISGWPRKCLTSFKTVHSNTCRMFSGIILLEIRPVYSKRNGSKTVHRMVSTYRCAVNVPLMTPKGTRLSNGMAPQTIISD